MLYPDQINHTGQEKPGLTKPASALLTRYGSIIPRTIGFNSRRNFLKAFSIGSLVGLYEFYKPRNLFAGFDLLQTNLPILDWRLLDRLGYGITISNTVYQIPGPIMPIEMESDFSTLVNLISNPNAEVMYSWKNLFDMNMPKVKDVYDIRAQSSTWYRDILINCLGANGELVGKNTSESANIITIMNAIQNLPEYQFPGTGDFTGQIYGMEIDNETWELKPSYTANTSFESGTLRNYFQRQEVGLRILRDSLTLNLIDEEGNWVEVTITLDRPLVFASNGMIIGLIDNSEQPASKPNNQPNPDTSSQTAAQSNNSNGSTGSDTNQPGPDDTEGFPDSPPPGPGPDDAGGFPDTTPPGPGAEDPAGFPDGPAQLPGGDDEEGF